MDLATAWAVKARQQAEEEAKPLLLPSGITIMARRPGPAMLASYSRLPIGLAVIAKAQEGEGDGSGDTGAGIEAAKFLYDVLTSCVVSPRISHDGGAGTIHPKDIPDADVQFIIAWALRGEEAQSLATFRDKRADGNAGHDSSGVQPETEHPAGHHRPGSGSELRPGGRHSAGTAETAGE